jgi:hypothetical protein
MKQAPITPEETATERSLLIILGAFAIGVTVGVVGLAAVLVSLPSN